MANATDQSALTVETTSRPARRGSLSLPPPRTPQVEDIMTRKLVTATAETPVPKLLDEMARYGISGIPIVDTEARIVGIVTEADLVSQPVYGGSHRHERPWESKARDLTAGAVMTTEVQTAQPFEAVHTAARRMVKCGIKRLPVVDNDRLVGIVSLTDVLRSYS